MLKRKIGKNGTMSQIRLGAKIEEELGWKVGDDLLLVIEDNKLIIEKFKTVDEVL